MTEPASEQNLTITMNHKGRKEVWYPGKRDSLNLKGTCRTLDGSNGDNKRAKLENGLISRARWAVIDGSGMLYEDTGDNSDYATRFAMTDFIHHINGKKAIYVVKPRHGYQPSLVKSRAWTFNILNAEMPKTVKINGRGVEQKAWDYKAESKMLTIRVPETDCKKKIEVSVDYL